MQSTNSAGLTHSRCRTAVQTPCTATAAGTERNNVMLRTDVASSYNNPKPTLKAFVSLSPSKIHCMCSTSSIVGIELPGPCVDINVKLVSWVTTARRIFSFPFPCTVSLRQTVTTWPYLLVHASNSDYAPSVTDKRSGFGYSFRKNPGRISWYVSISEYTSTNAYIKKCKTKTRRGLTLLW